MTQNDALIAFVIFQAVFFFLDIYVYSKTNRDIARKGEYTFFCALIIIHMFYLIMNSLWSLQEHGILHLSKTGMYLICMGSFLAITACAFVFFRFTIERIRFFPVQKKSVQMLFLLPEMLTLILILLSPWNHLVFHLDEANTIVHGPAYLVMMGSASLYLLAVAVISVINFFTVKNKIFRRANVALFVSVVIIIAFVFLDDLLPKVSILPVAVFAVIIVIFINMQMSNINSDALTGLFNRRMADDFLQKQFADISEHAPLYLYMCDINSFKSINDQYGHMEGDLALQLCGNVLRQVTLAHEGFAARFGGDEFLLSWQPEENSLSDPEILVQEIEQKLTELSRQKGKPYRLSMCIGYSICTNREETLQSCLHRADEMLYARKKAYHAAIAGSQSPHQ